MKVFVESLGDGNLSWKVAVAVRQTDTVASLKKVIQQSKDIPEQSQHLMFNSVELENEKTLAFCKVLDGTQLKLQYDLIVCVEVPTHNEEYSLKVDPFATVEDLKKLVSSSHGIPVSKQALFGYRSMEHELKKHRSLLHYDVLHHYNRLYLESREDPELVDIAVQTSTGKRFSLRINLEDNVAILRGKFAQALRCSLKEVADVELSLNGLVFEDEKVSLAKYSVTNNSILDARLLTCLMDHASIFVRPSGASFTVKDVSCLDTVGSIKKKIEKKCKIPAEQLFLYRYRSFRHLRNNSRTLFDYGILSVPFDLTLFNYDFFYITNDLLGRKYILYPEDGSDHENDDSEDDESQKEHTVLSLKKVIQKKFGIDVGDQYLSFKGVSIGEDEESEDAKLASYGIGKGSEIQLTLRRRRRHVPVTMTICKTAHTLRLKMKANDTAKDVLAKVGSVLDIEMMADYILCSEACKIINGSLASNGIVGDYSHLRALKTSGQKPVDLRIFLKTLTGKTIALFVNSFSRIEDVRQQIQDKEGFPTDQQRLVFNGKLLEDKHMLFEYNMTNDSVFHLVLNLRGC